MPTARAAPVGTPLPNGYQTLIAFADDPNVSFWEKVVGAPGIDGGDAIDTTTMHNTSLVTMRANALYTVSEFQVVVAYDPLVIDQIVALINVEGLITLHFPDTSTDDFYGFLRVFERAQLARGTHPEATITITPTGYNVDSGIEAGITYTANAGT